MKKGIGLIHREPPGAPDEMDGDMEEMGMEYGDPAPRKPAPADQGGPDFDPTDQKQKPRNYDRYADAARQEAEKIQKTVRGRDAGNAMMEWRRKWMERAKEAGLDDRQASQALDDVEDSL